MNINMGSIMGKVRSFSASSGGQTRMRACIENYEKEGRTTTAAGDKLLTEDMMWEAAAKMITVLRSTASEYDLPESVMKHFDSLDCAKPYRMPDGTMVVNIYFGDKFDGGLHRDSLEDGSDYYGGQFGGYTGEGINNIIALFNNGAHAKNFTYGWWNNHRPTGEASYRSGGFTANDAWVQSRKDREPLHFIQQAVMDFNGNYGYEYGVTAVAGEEYH